MLSRGVSDLNFQSHVCNKLCQQNDISHDSSFVNSPGHNQNWIYGDVIQLSKMAATRRDTMLGHFSALF